MLPRIRAQRILVPGPSGKANEAPFVCGVCHGRHDIIDGIGIQVYSELMKYYRPPISFFRRLYIFLADIHKTLLAFRSSHAHAPESAFYYMIREKRTLNYKYLFFFSFRELLKVVIRAVLLSLAQKSTMGRELNGVSVFRPSIH